MNKKYFFFDIDGTLTTKNPGGEVLPSTLNTIKQLKENGHFVAIATGRSFHDAKDYLDLFKIDCMVHDGGYGVTINNQLICKEPLDKNKALAVCLECLEKEIPFCVVMDDSKHCISHHDAFLKGREMYRDFFQLQVIENLDYTKIENFYKIYIGCDETLEKEITSLRFVGHLRYFENHMNVEPDDKAVGIKKMMTYLSASLEDLVVFGDGHNDVTMFQLAPTCIAMGNACDELKNIATYITSRSDEDGIEKACRYFNWI